MMTLSRGDDRWTVWDKRIRDIVLFLVGILGMINELFILDEPRPYALVFIASLVGLPFVFAKDEQRRKGNGNDQA